MHTAAEGAPAQRIVMRDLHDGSSSAQQPRVTGLYKPALHRRSLRTEDDFEMCAASSGQQYIFRKANILFHLCAEGGGQRGHTIR